MRFEQSFRVRKICKDANVITEFKKKWDKEDASFSKSSNVCILLFTFSFTILDLCTKLI
jgi:hypothetical protein